MITLSLQNAAVTYCHGKSIYASITLVAFDVAVATSVVDLLDIAAVAADIVVALVAEHELELELEMIHHYFVALLHLLSITNVCEIFRHL